MQAEDIVEGGSYACRFRTRTFVNTQGDLVDTRNIQPGQAVPGTPGDYEGFGIIVARDNSKRLVKIQDYAHPHREWIVAYDSVWDIDTVEWIDEAHAD
jgi:hypothetical protein